MSLLQINGVTKRFGAVQVLNGVDLTIEAGTVTGLVGDNGAGKSTLMKIITGIYAIDEGEVRLSGEPLNGISPGERRQRRDPPQPKHKIMSTLPKLRVVTARAITTIGWPHLNAWSRPRV